MATNSSNHDAKDNFPDFWKQDSMVKSHMPLKLYKKLYHRTTPLGVTIDQCIQIGCEQAKPEEKIIGLVAGDEYCFETFKELFDPVIDEYHEGFGPNEKQPPCDLDADKLVNGVLDEKYVKSCRVRTARNLKGVCLPPCVCRAERRLVEEVFTTALNSLDGDLKGAYYPLTKLTKEQEDALRADHFLFQKPISHILNNSGACRDWPTNRGIWHNNLKSFLAWINEEDHCRIMAMQKGGDMKAVFARFSRGLQEVEKKMKESGHAYQWSDRLGYLSACPSNIGTGLRCSVHMQLKNLGKHPDFKTICKNMQLDKRGTGGENTATVDDTYDISNASRVRKTEREFVQDVIDGVNKLIEMEKTLEAGGTITIPQSKKDETKNTSKGVCVLL